ncbi:UNC5C-like protein [Glandiceps talaboti]
MLLGVCNRSGDDFIEESQSVVVAICVISLIIFAIAVPTVYYCVRKHCGVGPCCKPGSKSCTACEEKEKVLSDIIVSYLVEEPPAEKIRPIRLEPANSLHSKNDAPTGYDMTWRPQSLLVLSSCKRPFPSIEPVPIQQVVEVDVVDQASDNETTEAPSHDLELYVSEAKMHIEKAKEEGTSSDIVHVFSNAVFSAGLFNVEGGYLTLENMDISLFIPPGALQEKEEMVYLYLSCEEKDRHPVSPGTVSVSSVIQCGPSGLKFQERVVLSYQHCADDASGDVRVAVLSSDSDEEKDPVYKNLKDDETSMCIIQENKCIVYVSHFTGFTSVAETVITEKHEDQGSQTETVVAKKWVEIIGFHGTLNTDVKKLPIRVYCVNKTTDAKQLVLEEEYRMSGYQADAPKTMSFLDSGLDLEFQMIEINKSWKIDGTGPIQSIDNEAVMTSSYTACSYRMAKVDDTSKTFDCAVNSFQRENPKYDQNKSLRVNFTVNEEKQASSRLGLEDIKAKYALKGKQLTTPRLKYHHRVELSHKLDPNSPLGNDWRMVADKIGLSYDTIQQIEAQFQRNIIASPTREVLKYWDAMNRESSTGSDEIGNLKKLKNILESSERSDAAEIVNNVISTMQK